MSRPSALSTEIIDKFVAPQCHASVEILYQDDDILLINKPSGLLSLSGKNPLNWDSVHHRLLNGQNASQTSAATPEFPSAILPHRLDLGTSGIMVVGLNAQASKSLNRQFQTRTVQKRYLAMLEGWVSADSGQISTPIAKDKAIFPRVKLCISTGKEAITEYKVLHRMDNPRRTLVQYTPITGRTHQLRIHSLKFGHPILGCDLYNLHSENSDRGARATTHRLMLHASDIYFSHPVTGKSMYGHSPNPFSNEDNL
jgi:tRNA pseudouridine32 synthase/23S rRNA pseudouridine746 synthase